MHARRYFTSESHVHSLVNAFRYVGDNLPSGSFLSQESSKLLAEVSELDYLTHIVFRLYENFKVRGVAASLSHLLDTMTTWRACEPCVGDRSQRTTRHGSVSRSSSAPAAPPVPST